MKNILIVLAFLSVSLINAQAFIGKGDNKIQVGANFQDNATGLNVSYDFGIGENISLGFSSTYALGINSKIEDAADFSDRYDIKARFNANIGNVINIGNNFDFYPGLNFSLKNFGGHVGSRYMFTSGFGVYTELNFPLAKYSSDKLLAHEKIHNQFTVSFGAVFNLQ